MHSAYKKIRAWIAIGAKILIRIPIRFEKEISCDVANQSNFHLRLGKSLKWPFCMRNKHISGVLCQSDFYEGEIDNSFHILFVSPNQNLWLSIMTYIMLKSSLVLWNPSSNFQRISKNVFRLDLSEISFSFCCVIFAAAFTSLWIENVRARNTKHALYLKIIEHTASRPCVFIRNTLLGKKILS